MMVKFENVHRTISILECSCVGIDRNAFSLACHLQLSQACKEAFASLIGRKRESIRTVTIRMSVAFSRFLNPQAIVSTKDKQAIKLSVDLTPEEIIHLLIQTEGKQS